ncbi:MAG: hypothetical protein IPK81_01430 [Rhodospirillales bacterium]|nr:hypothetical protein [Rhodospirillales bacterium]QQS12964.1 MAG: hypothetical protein IPK81_01430 [Rhodospirillales bacterium]
MRRRPAVAVAATTSADPSSATRRRTLVWGGGALLAAAGLAAFGRRAAAITLVEPDAKTRELLNAACGANADHERILADARAALDGKAPPPALAVVDCPACGCRLRLDDGASLPPRR